jgi:subtilisin family serine protease
LRPTSPRHPGKLVRPLVLLVALGGIHTVSSSALDAADSADRALLETINWSIAHEGCRAFYSPIPGERADRLKPASDLRACYLDSQRQNQNAIQLLNSTSLDKIATATQEAIRQIPDAYQLRTNFDWVLMHEGQLGVMKQLDRASDFESIRRLYATYQAHNPNARALLAAVPDSQLHQFISERHVTVQITPQSSPATLDILRSITEPGDFVATEPLTLKAIAKNVYDDTSADVLDLIIKSNPGIFGAATTKGAEDIFVRAGTHLSVPFKPKVNAATVVSLRAGVSEAYAEAIAAEDNDATLIDDDLTGYIEASAQAVLAGHPGDPQAYTDWFIGALHADQISGRELGLMTNDVVIGVVDGGVDLTHPLLIDSCWRVPPSLHDDHWITGACGYDYIRHTANPFDEMPESHGTHVAGAVTGKSLMHFAPKIQASPIGGHIRIAAMKVAAKENTFQFVAAENAIEDALDKGIKLFNLSFRGPYSKILNRDLGKAILSNGSLFVLAAGNDTLDLNNYTGIHGTFRDQKGIPLGNVIMVAAIDDLGRVPRFSNYGNKVVQIAAPGVQIPSTLRDNRFGPLNGTSMAAPFVTLTAAMILARKATIPLPDVKKRILDTCDFDPSLEASVIEGCRLNMAKAVNIGSDLLETKAGGLLVGTIDATQFTVLDSVTNKEVMLDEDPHSILRIWASEDGRMKVITSGERKWVSGLTNPTVTIQLEDGEKCPNDSGGGPCLVKISDLKDVIFRLN